MDTPHDKIPAVPEAVAIRIDHEKVKELRIKLGLSQRQLGMDCGVHQAHISLIETNAFEKRGISLDLAVKLSRALGVLVDDLLVILPAPPRKPQVRRRGV